ncbi:hypothetical protein ABPG75_003539 [Micractinium tetrahymenae]
MCAFITFVEPRFGARGLQGSITYSRESFLCRPGSTAAAITCMVLSTLLSIPPFVAMLALSMGAGVGPRLHSSLGGLLALSPSSLGCLRTLNTAALDSDQLQEHDKRYVDRLKLTARAGKGGNGCASFYQGASRGKHAVADGGSGGNGGNVVVRAVSNMKSLAGVQQLYKAEPGQHGTRQRQHGRAGHDTVVLVPVGTVVQRLRQPQPEADGVQAAVAGSAQQGWQPRWQHGRRADSVGTAPGAQQQGAAEAGDAAAEQEPELPEWLRRWRRPFSGADYDSDASDDDFLEEVSISSSSRHGGHSSGGAAADNVAGQAEHAPAYEMLGDLVQDGQEVVVARGGAGGRGNAGLKARAHRPAPADAQRGQPGEVSRLLLELKLLADIGLVGVPNAGKSTLLRALTAATPRVGDYAFTTLAPQLGVVPPPVPIEEPIVVADIPGLIEGAHENRGLGHHFLRHIERTQAIAYVLDCAAGSSGRAGRKPAQQLRLLQEELEAYSPRLAALPALVVANKADLLRSPGRSIQALQRSCGGLPVVAISAKEQATLVSKPGSPAAPSWLGSLRPLHFHLAQLLHRAGARQQAPDWGEYAR